MNGSSMMEDLAFDPSLSSSGDQGQDMDLVCQETIWIGIALHLWERPLSLTYPHKRISIKHLDKSQELLLGVSRGVTNAQIVV